MSGNDGREALDSAEFLLATKGRSFDWARYFLGRKHALRATRLYGFCRHLDDMADEAASEEGALEKLEGVRRDLGAGSSADPVIRDGMALMRECAIEDVLVLELAAGVISDLGCVRMSNESELLRYCYRVAGTVGLMMCHVLDVDDPAAFPHAIDLGIAMQLTNICRDVGEDAAMGRRYLPATLVGDIAPEELASPTSSHRAEIQRGILHLLSLAENYYRSGEAGLAYLPLQARAAILVAARIYRAIGEDLRSRGGDCWSRRAVVTPFEKTVITARALGTLPFNKSFWDGSLSHEATLHSYLTGLPCVAHSVAT
jgi:15-cis-phytoene synthase